MDWQKAVRKQQTARRRAFFLRLALLLVVWFGLAILGWFAWAYLLRSTPPVQGAVAAFAALGGILTALFGHFGPTLPFRGRAPEEVAAQAFLAGGDIRYDDDQYEPDLKP